ncbi:tRNA-uridine aminocarboxypropyltransferase [Massilia sp. GCM10020059]|uniref:tRNA-uridine aminocarboxypropyltransferase n=1 Tax=Massilia agrisoli TaxID=2892444 RepID=A0ABS8ISX6_9BURK|nr:tRNA-uridine aminocarboxypropyltransferase [Massilia agrisoli]MCC6071684.1 DTW domain-containing protein [Massilia agrisoli]
MPDITPTKRQMCPACLRPARTCICQLAAPVASRVEVLILQHPLEVANAKGSARLLHLSLPGSAMATGEVFDAAALRALLHGGGRQPVLLYPNLPGERSLGMAPPPSFDTVRHLDPARLRLVVLDGTWRKSRKMLYLNRPLQEIPRLPLTQAPPSLYRIRKAHAPDQLSTLEAAAYALMQIEGNVEHFQPILDGFDAFVDRYATLSAHA